MKWKLPKQLRCPTCKRVMSAHTIQSQKYSFCGDPTCGVRSCLFCNVSYNGKSSWPIRPRAFKNVPTFPAL